MRRRDDETTRRRDDETTRLQSEAGTELRATSQARPGQTNQATVVFRTVRPLSCVSCCAVRSVTADSLYWAHVPYDNRSSDVFINFYLSDPPHEDRANFSVNPC